jgi:hypothetical protein
LSTGGTSAIVDGSSTVETGPLVYEGALRPGFRVGEETFRFDIVDDLPSHICTPAQQQHLLGFATRSSNLRPENGTVAGHVLDPARSMRFVGWPTVSAYRLIAFTALVRAADRFRERPSDHRGRYRGPYDARSRSARRRAALFASSSSVATSSRWSNTSGGAPARIPAYISARSSGFWAGAIRRR